MRIDGSLPMHIARAYGMPIVGKPQSAHKLSLSSQVASAAPARSLAPGAGVNQLIAAKVTKPIDFNTTATPSTREISEALPLYTRAADRIEAATAVQIGRQLDVSG